jgi:DNA-binding MarR family transcriptional regulator
MAPTDAAALNAVGTAPGCSIAEVRLTLGITHPGTVRTIDRLVDAGLVERRTGRDGRTVGLHLTAEGERTWRAQAEARIDWLRATIAKLTKTEQADLERVTSRLLAAMTSDYASAERICRHCDESRCPQTRCPVTLAIEEDT